MSTDNFWTDELVAEFINYLYPSRPNWLEERIKEFKNLNNRKMAQLTNNHWAIQVPDDAQELDISYGRLIWVTRDSVGYETLTDGSWQFLFTTKEATEEDARKVVEVFNAFGSGDLYKDYIRQYMWLNKSIQSLDSLLRSKSLNPDNNHAIIQNTSHE